MKKVTVGSTVRIRCNTWSGEISQEGMVLPPTVEGYITLKLVNGYNVTYQESMIVEVNVLNEPKADDGKTTENVVQSSENLPLITIIHTGGTIASKVDYDTGAVVARFEPGELLSANPELGDIARINTVKLGNMWSDDIRPQHWNKMIEATKLAFDSGSKGVVVAHGTDTMHISAAALAFAWSGGGEKAPGRIVFTGSQRSSDRGSSDAGENLLAAVHWAANGPVNSGEMGDTSVIIMHADSSDGKCAVMAGTNSRKNHSTKRGAFQTINTEPLAYLSVDRNNVQIEMNASYSSIKSNRAVCETPTYYDVNIKIAQLVAGPHLNADMVTHAMNTGYEGLILAGTGLGHLPIENPLGDAPENIELSDAIKSYISKGGIAVMTTQCINGPVNMDVYSKGRDQQEIGIIGQQTTNSLETASVKLHWLLSNIPDNNDRNEWVKQNWPKNLTGENPISLKQ